MVSTASILAILFTLVVSILGPVLLAILFIRKTHAGILSTAVGAGIFILFALILEQGMHLIVLVADTPIRAVVTSSPFLYALYGGLAAGVFEECGRFVAFTFLLRGRREWKHGVAYGIGHGGIEAILLAGLPFINNLVYAVMINSGTFDKLTQSLTSDQAAALLSAKSALINTAPYLFAVGGIERIFAVTVHIGFSLIVLYAVAKKKPAYLFLAIGLHALLDFPAALSQKGVLPTWSVEVCAGIFAVAALLFILTSKKHFPTPEITADVVTPTTADTGSEG